ncbi:DUF5132 domain-containing protein [Ectobacillus polymachus]|uniref:DUF5132 domain-containing protein n=1 Tax=Ectobacillus polymachus TaxID=1508806 RepID=UPI003A84C0C7
MVEKYVHRVIVGSALLLAATAVIPIAKKTLRPIVRDLSKQTKYWIVSAKEGVEDIVAEVKFERMKKRLDQQNVIECDVCDVEIVPNTKQRIFQ